MSAPSGEKTVSDAVKAVQPGYLAGAMNALSPWGSRSASPKVGGDKASEADAARDTSKSREPSTSAASASKPEVQRGGDHAVSHRHRLSLRKYPRDCPRLDVQWFHAVDVAKRKTSYVSTPAKEDKPARPKKWNAFSTRDSRSIEAAFAKLSDEEDHMERLGEKAGVIDGDLGVAASESTKTAKHNPDHSTTLPKDKHGKPIKVPVNEDYLFDVDVKERELGPAYWLGPVYEVRRGTWFDGSTLLPIEENLATQLEEGFLKTRPWRSLEQPPARSQTMPPGSDEAGDGARGDATDPTKLKPVAPKAPTPLLTHRLFGSYMNQTATYTDSATAWVLSDDFLSKFSSAMFQRFVGGAGTKYIRGYSEVVKKKAPKDAKRSDSPTRNADGTRERRKSMPETASEIKDSTPRASEEPQSPQETRMRVLERQMSNLTEATLKESRQKQAEEERLREEKEIREDYRDTSGERQDREIEHLILVTHGIGQRLGARFESFNFIHDVNELRKTLKTVYGTSLDLQMLNDEVDKEQKNCRVQVLPICWRHLLDFPHQGIKQNRKEHDITDLPLDEEDEYPSLESITVEGVPALRNILSDLALDILLYQTPVYKNHISRIVVNECNRTLKLFKKRNPQFKGKVSLVGHSLGSAIMFDILSDQHKDAPLLERPQPKDYDLRLHFDVEDLFCLGSPIGLFQMLKGRKVAGRGNPNKVTLDGYPDSLDDPYTLADGGAATNRLPGDMLTDVQRDALVSSPKCRQLYNIFHPSDPVGYRLEPLISPAMSSLKPQALPYTKKNFFSAPMGQGFTGIPAKMGQSFSGFWSNFSSGLANSFITRSMGLSAEDAAALGAPAPPAAAVGPHALRALAANQARQSSGAGTNLAGGVVPAPKVLALDAPAAPSRLPSASLPPGAQVTHPPTLIDTEMDTLYAGFQRRRRVGESDAATRDLGSGPASLEIEERARRLRREEAKVRALNANGRVDYSIQEGAFDISFLASIASHLAYWTDEDVAHFLVSQLLSRNRAVRARRAGSTTSSSSAAAAAATAGPDRSSGVGVGGGSNDASLEKS